MKRFNPNTVKPSSYLAVLTNKQKAQGVKEYKRSLRLADEAANPAIVKKVRDYAHAITVNVPMGKRQARLCKSGCRMSPAKRALVSQRASDRKALFASLGVAV